MSKNVLIPVEQGLHTTAPKVGKDFTKSTYCCRNKNKSVEIMLLFSLHAEDTHNLLVCFTSKLNKTSLFSLLCLTKQTPISS